MTQDKTQHTPGPWELVESSPNSEGWSSYSKVIIPEHFDDNGNDSEDELHIRLRANARLIAAAPTMFAYIEKNALTSDSEAKLILEAICQQ